MKRSMTKKVAQASRLPALARSKAGGTPALLLSFYGDDFTGSTDALERLTLAGIRTALFIAPPTAKQLARFTGLQAIGVAGHTRSLAPAAMERELRPALLKLKKLGARHVHYKVCSTFDSSPKIGSIGRVIDVGATIFKAPFVPVLAAAPSLGRYTVFGTHFARYGIGSVGGIHRLDRHPSISQHPVTPMTEADLRLHLAKQTSKQVALFDVLNVELPVTQAHRALRKLLKQNPDAVLFDTLTAKHLKTIGAILESYASARRPLFSVGSSGVEAALAANLAGDDVRSLTLKRCRVRLVTSSPASQVLIGSGSCSPVTSGQIAWALKHGFAEVPMNTRALASRQSSVGEIQRVERKASSLLAAGRSVIIHTTRRGSDKRLVVKLGKRTAEVLGGALGTALRLTLAQHSARLCIAGGDTSSYAARALGIEAVEMIAPLTPGAPLCRAAAPNSPADGLEVVFKGGQVGPENYFEIVRNGRT